MRILFLLLVSVLASLNIHAQDEKKVISALLNGMEAETINRLDVYKKYNFSDSWLQTPNNNVFGIIGDDYQCIRVKLISITQDNNAKELYYVYGKSMINNKIRDFQGKIKLEKIFLYIPKYNLKVIKEEGMWEEYEKIKESGLVIANYEFFENNQLKNSGYFEGKMYASWILNTSDIIQYDYFNNGMSDSFFNNAFIGEWKMYNSDLTKECKWGDYRVPLSRDGFDIGAGEFSPSENYCPMGWDSYLEENEWWK